MTTQQMDDLVKEAIRQGFMVRVNPYGAVTFTMGKLSVTSRATPRTEGDWRRLIGALIFCGLEWPRKLRRQ